MTSNVPLEKNKMASTLAISVIIPWSVYKMQGRAAVESERKSERNRKCCAEETENV